MEFDRELMIMDKKNPITQSLVRHIIPSEENAKVISEFYPGTTMQEVKKALEGMISYNNLLVAPLRIKRWFIYLLLKVSGNYKEMHGFYCDTDCSSVRTCARNTRRYERF